MREIKYKAWDLVEARMRAVAFIEFDAAGDIANIALIGKPLDKKHGYVARFDERPDGEDLILMQFTGLRDAEGKEIYEGDILKWTAPEPDMVDSSWPSEVTVVGFTTASFTRKNIQGEEEALDCNVGDVENGVLVSEEVIGNIYENPDLLANPQQA